MFLEKNKFLVLIIINLDPKFTKDDYEKRTRGRNSSLLLYESNIYEMILKVENFQVEP